MSDSLGFVILLSRLHGAERSRGEPSLTTPNPFPEPLPSEAEIRTLGRTLCGTILAWDLRRWRDLAIGSYNDGSLTVLDSVAIRRVTPIQYEGPL